MENMSLKVKGIFNLYANYCPTINRSCGVHFKNPICPCTVKNPNLLNFNFLTRNTTSQILYCIGC